VTYKILLSAFGFPYRINNLPAVVKNILRLYLRKEICLCSSYFLKYKFVSVGGDFYFATGGEFAD